MKRFTWQEMKTYWETHSVQRASDLDFEQDPDALGNVCHPGGPLWINRYLDRSHKLVFNSLLQQIPDCNAGAHALDVGCGAGRWCRTLSEQGYHTTGIDLQSELVELNQQRYPNMEFHCIPIQDFKPTQPFDLISAVTVLLHNPPDHQQEIIHQFRTWLTDGGFIILMDNIDRSQAPHVFPNSIQEWQHKFEKASFRCLAVRRYDYSPAIRLLDWTESKIRNVLGRTDTFDGDIDPETFANRSGSEASPGLARSILNTVQFGTLRTAVVIDSIMDPLLITSRLPLPAVSCGFLFQAV